VRISGRRQDSAFRSERGGTYATWRRDHNLRLSRTPFSLDRFREFGVGRHKWRSSFAAEFADGTGELREHDVRRPVTNMTLLTRAFTDAEQYRASWSEGADR
jgi:hypothetical protein